MENGDAPLAPPGRAGHRGVSRTGRLRPLVRLASPQELDGAEADAALEEYREWSAAGRPGAISQAAARTLLLGEAE